VPDSGFLPHREGVPAILKKTFTVACAFCENYSPGKKEKEPRSSVLIADNTGYIFTHQRDDFFQKTGMKAIQKEGIAELSLFSAEGYTHVRPWCAKK
jgi:hypothetical protein